MIPVTIVILVPLLVCVLFASALYGQWRRMSGADHAARWMGAFVVAGLGWLATMIQSLLATQFVFPGSAIALCWFAATLLGVSGIRQRAGRPDRGIVLLAIWLGTTIGVSLLDDLFVRDPVERTAMVMAVVAGGAMLAGVAVGPRHRRSPRSSWLGAAFNGAFAILCLLLGGVALRFPTIDMTAFAVVILVPISVLFGVTMMSCLTEDRADVLERLARTDALTGVWNRRGFEEGARHLLDRLRRTGGTIAAVAIADIDGFKGINDGHGHAVGDATLARFAETLRSAVEAGDLLARLGGEEFAILALGVDGPALRQRMERVRSLLSVPSIDPNGPPLITASFGVATLDADHRSLRDALERADRALYQAKNGGRNRVMLAE